MVAIRLFTGSKAQMKWLLVQQEVGGKAWCQNVYIRVLFPIL